jgi:hypothetical protein
VVAGLGIAAVFSILALASLVINRLHRPAPAPEPAAIPAAGLTAADGSEALTRQVDDLIDAAQKAHIRPSDIAALNDTRSKLTELAASKAPAAQFAAVATDMAKSEGESLGRAERRMLRDAGAMPGPADAPGSADAVAKLQKAKADLTATLAAPIAQGTAQIVAQTQAMLAGYAAFQDAYGAVAPILVTARRNSFDGLHTATKSLCDQISALASVEKPWFLASSVRKTAYQLRQDNAAQAKALAQQLDDLAGTVAASNDLRELGAAISQATDGKTKATQLYASSSAAAL